jgi:hypothetical protein
MDDLLGVKIRHLLYMNTRHHSFTVCTHRWKIRRKVNKVGDFREAVFIFEAFVCLMTLSYHMSFTFPLK